MEMDAKANGPEPFYVRMTKKAEQPEDKEKVKPPQ
jgi:hypothetical protein